MGSEEKQIRFFTVRLLSTGIQTVFIKTQESVAVQAAFPRPFLRVTFDVLFYPPRRRGRWRRRANGFPANPVGPRCVRVCV